MSGLWLVGLGSLLGGLARVLVAILMEPGGANTPAPEGLEALPWATVFANTTGSFAIGMYAMLCGPTGRWPASQRQQQFVIAGLCGGYTTFSIFSLDVISLLTHGEPALAAAWALGNLALWLGAAALGMGAGKSLCGAGSG